MTEHRTKFWERPRVEQNEIIEQIGSQRGYTKGGKFKFQIHGLLLCRTAVCRFYGITLKRWERYTDLNNPVRKLRKTREFEAPKRRNLIGWMSYYFSLRGKSGGEWMPHENTLQISYTGKVTLYQDMRIDYLTRLDRDESEVAGYPYFVEILNEHFSHVKIGGYNTFAKCDHCSALDLEAASTRNRPTLKRIGRAKAAHKKIYMAEKRKYWHHINKAVMESSKCIITIGDGMEQGKTETPWFTRPPYALNNCATAGFAVQGIINHSHDPKTVAFIVSDLVKKGANFTMEWLVQDLSMVSILLLARNFVY
jgi:hypothetical protein